VDLRDEYGIYTETHLLGAVMREDDEALSQILSQMSRTALQETFKYAVDMARAVLLHYHGIAGEEIGGDQEWANDQDDLAADSGSEPPDRASEVRSIPPGES
jgi:hypothetical protein